MSQTELFDIDSPCIGICTMNKKGYCIGCLRNRQERQQWHGLSDDDKHKVLMLIARRKRRIGEHREKSRSTHAAQEQLGLFIDELDE